MELERFCGEIVAFGCLVLDSWGIEFICEFGDRRGFVDSGGRFLCCMLFFLVGVSLCHYVGRDPNWGWIYEAEAQPGVCLEWWWPWGWCMLKDTSYITFSSKKPDMDWDFGEFPLACFSSLYYILWWSALQFDISLVAWWPNQKVIVFAWMLLLFLVWIHINGLVVWLCCISLMSFFYCLRD